MSELSFAKRTAVFLRLLATDDLPFIRLHEQAREATRCDNAKFTFSDTEKDTAAVLGPTDAELDAMLKARGDEALRLNGELLATVASLRERLRTLKGERGCLVRFIETIFDLDGDSYQYHHIRDRIAQCAASGKSAYEVEHAIEVALAGLLK